MGDNGAEDTDMTAANVVEGVLLARKIDMSKMIAVAAGVILKGTSLITGDEVKTPLLEEVEEIGMVMILITETETIGIDREITN